MSVEHGADPFGTGGRMDGAERPVAVVTGGAGGMGLATAALLGRDHRVLITDVRRERLDDAVEQLRRGGASCEARTCDVTSRGEVDELATHAASLGRVVALVHAAGVSPSMGTAEAIVRINALGTLFVDQAFAPVLQEGGSIVNVASVAGHLTAPFLAPTRSYELAFSDPERLVERVVARCRVAPRTLRPGMGYSLSKHFVIWLSRRLTGPLGARGVRIVSVSPGSIDTEMGQLEESKGSGALARRSALGRFGTVEEIAEVLAFLASDRPGYLTGTDVLVDGGGRATMSFKDMIEMARRR